MIRKLSWFIIPGLVAITVGFSVFATGGSASVQTIAFTSTVPSNALVGEGSYTPTATASSGLPVSFTLDAASTGCTLVAAVVSFAGAGTCVIAAHQAGNATSHAAATVHQSFAIARNSQSIRFTSTVSSNARVGAGTYAPSATASSGLPVTLTRAATSKSCLLDSGIVTFIAAGTCVIYANQAGNVTYRPASQASQSFTISRNSQSIRFTSAVPPNAAVGSGTYAPTATASSGLPVTLARAATSRSCQLASGVVTFTAAGTCVIYANQAGNAAYRPASQASQSFTISRNSQSITFTSTAPPNAAVGSGSYTPSAVASSGLPVTLIRAATSKSCALTSGVVTFTAAGTCVIYANQAGNAAYRPASQASQSFTISRNPQTITFTSAAPLNAVVGSGTYTPLATASSGLPVTLTRAATSKSCELTSGVVAFTAAGTCVIYANQAGNATYQPAAQVGQAFAISTPSLIWSAPHAIDVGGNSLTSVSCVSSAFCMTVDSSGRSLWWNATTWSNPMSLGVGSITSVSCASSTYCAAVNENGSAFTWNAASWSTPGDIDGSNGLTSVSCPSAGFCVAVDDRGNALTYDGINWSAPDDIDGTDRLTSVSCTSESSCIAVDDGGNALTYDGTSWSAPFDIDGTTTLTSVSCASGSSCIAVDDRGNALTYDGTSWPAPYDIDGTTALTSVSCSSQSFCVAVDDLGNALAYDGATWSRGVADPGHVPSSVSCVSQVFCMAVDQAGNALIGT